MVLRELFMRLGLDVNGASFAKGQIAASAITSVVSTLGTAAIDTAKHFVEMVRNVAEGGKNIEETAQATGLTTRALQELRSVASQTGLATEDLDGGMFKLSRTMYAVKKGSEEQAKTFSHLGVKVTDARGHLRATDEVIGDLAASFAKMPDGAEKTALAMEVFGRSGARLIPMLNKGKDGIDEMKKSAVIMSEEQIAASKEITKTQFQLGNVTKKLWKEAIVPLLPAINALLKQYLAWRKANAAIMAQRIREYIGYLITGVQKLGGLFDFLIKNATGLKVILGAGGLIAVFTALEWASVKAAAAATWAWIKAAAPFLAIAALVAGIMLLFDDIRVYNKGGKSAYGRFKKEIDAWLKPNDKDPWFVKAIKSFVQLMEDAITVMKEFDRITGKGENATSDRTKVNKASPAWKREAGPGAPLTDVEKIKERIDSGEFVSIADRYKVEHADRLAARPVVPGPGPGGGNVTTVYAPKFEVTQLPGESGEDFARRVHELDAAKWEAANAALKR